MALRPSIRKLPDPILSGDVPFPRSWATDGAQLPLERSRSPKSPLEPSSRSPRGWRERDPGCVGLGIVAALDTAAAAANKLHVSAPITIISPRAATDAGGRGGRFEVSELGCSGQCATSVCGEIGGRSMRRAEADFLSCCYLCRKRLQGKDIYMYRGEKGFCSMECRYQQMVSDEYQEKCGAAATAAKPAGEISSSPYAGGGRIFFTGVVAA